MFIEVEGLFNPSNDVRCDNVPVTICYLYFQTNRREEAGGQSSKIVLKASELFDHKVYLHEVKLNFLYCTVPNNVFYINILVTYRYVLLALNCRVYGS